MATKAKTYQVKIDGQPWSGEFRHPSSRQDAPVAPGPYLIQSCPGDSWRRVNWCEGRFRCGAACQVWYAWKVIDDEGVKA